MPKKGPYLAFIVSISIHLVFFSAVFYIYKIYQKPHPKEKILRLNSIKLIKQKPKIIKKKKITPKPKKVIVLKQKPKPKPKPVVKHKPKPIIKPKPKPRKKVKKHIKKIIHKIKPIAKAVKKHKPQKKRKLPQITKHQTAKVATPKTVKQAPIILPKPAKSMPVPPKKISQKPDIEKEYIKLNLSKIISCINDEKFYPRRARRLHIEGVVKVKFLLKKDGSILIKKVICNKRFLKKATQKIIKRASKYFPKPPTDIMISVPIEFKLE